MFKWMLLMLSLWVWNFNLNAEISRLHNLSNFEEVVENIHGNTWVILDVDDVLITCKDPSLQEANKERLDKVCQHYAAQMSEEDYARLFSIAMRSREVEVIDPKIYELFDFLKEHQVKTIALTHTRTGRFGVIESVEQWRINELNHLGFNFGPLSPFQADIQFKQLEGPLGSPNVTSGVVFTAEMDKGPVLEEAIKAVQDKPQKIIFIDDRRDNLESVQAFCDKHQIDFEGFHYTAIQSKPIQYVDEKLIEIQLDTLMKEERWITSEEAAEAYNDDHF